MENTSLVVSAPSSDTSTNQDDRVVTEAPAMSEEERIEYVAEGFQKVLQGLGLDLTSPHLQDTPRRAAKAWVQELCRGHLSAPPKITTFPSTGASQMIILHDIPVRSVCAHHLLPFTGKGVVAYIPGKAEVLGLSKLSRIVNYWARRPQVQEELTNQIADFLWGLIGDSDYNDADGWVDRGGVGVLIRASHSCMSLRGVCHSGVMTTSALRGVFEQSEVRSEFLSLAKLGSV